MKIRTASFVVIVGCVAYIGKDLAKEYQLSDLSSDYKAIEFDNPNPAIQNVTSLIEANSTQRIKTLIPMTSYKTYESVHGPLPASLRGTTIPAYFELDSQNNLVVTPSIKTLIEYFLSGMGEEPIETSISRVEEYFAKHLVEPASSQAIVVLAEYLAYKESLLVLEQSNQEQSNLEQVDLGNSKQDYVALFQARREMRINSLSPEVYEAFFGEDDQLDQYTAELLKHRKLNGVDGKRQLSSIENLLPEREKLVKQAERVRQNISDAKAQGASSEELYTMRAEAYGHEAAERFALADQKQSEWDERYLSYRAKRDSILSSSGLSEQDKNSEITQLQASMFNRNERKRLATLDKMADKSSLL